jgi:cell division protease FtsH
VIRKANSRWRALGYTALIVWAAMTLGSFLRTPAKSPSYSEIKKKIEAGEVAEAVVTPTTISGTYKPLGDAKTGQVFAVTRVDDPSLLATLEAHGVEVRGEQGTHWWTGVLGAAVPFALLVAFLAWTSGQMRRQMSAMKVGQSKAKIYAEHDIKVTLADVAGVDEAKTELREIIDFLQDPKRLTRLGAKLPKGILLVGPPGTGKTLLARAVAGEARVPFFSISGSEFVEMFVGVGAARVRDLFTHAKERAPCIIFIDELDALGKVRASGIMSHDEREQTLNQLLVELDGFDTRTGVVLMAATNRPEILDPALLRAGRFDRHVVVDRPDKSGRRAILEVHAKAITLADPAALDVLAALTPGLVGADLANIVNEAALLAVRRNAAAVELTDLEEAVERIVAGLEKRSRVLTKLERERVAHHEVGHAIVALFTPELGSVQKISIIPRGVAALGYTVQLPTEERFLMTRGELEKKIMGLLGGRVAEELIFNEISTGAEDDLRKATDIARSMVTRYGMSAALGCVSLTAARQPFLMQGIDSERGNYSEAVARTVDEQIRHIIEEQYERTRALLSKHLDFVRSGAQALLAKETLSGDELVAIRERGNIVAHQHDGAASMTH